MLASLLVLLLLLQDVEHRVELLRNGRLFLLLPHRSHLLHLQAELLLILIELLSTHAATSCLALAWSRIASSCRSSRCAEDGRGGERLGRVVVSGEAAGSDVG